jgi:hypothetical protein
MDSCVQDVLFSDGESDLSERPVKTHLANDFSVPLSSASMRRVGSMQPNAILLD